MNALIVMPLVRHCTCGDVTHFTCNPSRQRIYAVGQYVEVGSCLDAFRAQIVLTSQQNCVRERAGTVSAVSEWLQSALLLLFGLMN